ncbi:MAG: hypothetical protein A2086_00125 [Spirochaetes bacterium GWD1_27_9]|nr:MAG: hypothetical protein A2Z98_10165 [Spirochaetes bacterium GWB1_27_13]OHD36009.1 MAG: hypothetical protein A2086_00125 [Spirochaetes bacterium GWD1_27_9]
MCDKLEKNTLLLSFMAYLTPDRICSLISKYLNKDFSVCWGPAYYNGDSIIKEGLAYIVKSTDKNPTYFIVFRGTNFFSVDSWCNQDFAVKNLIRWDRVPKENPSGDDFINPSDQIPAISEGANLSMNISVNKLKHNDQSIFDFLIDENKKLPAGQKMKIYVTGHSLGGLLSSTFGLWLNDKWNVENKPEIYIYSYAGPSAGNENFAKYSDSVFKNNCNRFVGAKDKNTKLDVAVNVWNEKEMSNIPNLYGDIKMNKLEKAAYDIFFENIQGKRYLQVNNDNPLIIKSRVYLSPLDSFSLEMAMQHARPYVAKLLECFIFGTERELVNIIIEESIPDKKLLDMVKP